MEYSPNLTARYLAGKIDEYVKFQGRDTLTSNAARDDRARWARIPDGKACDFCNMLGSRGFVYRSAEKAGEHNDYHPHCNCQVAVCFEPDMDYYTKNGVRVPRGYDPNDPEHAMLIDDLYAEYKAAGKRYTSSSTYRVFYNRMGTEQFHEAMRRLSDAKTLDELHEVGREIVDEWPGGAANADPDQWEEMSRHAREMEEALR